MSKEEHSKRIRKRLELQLPVRINCRETPDFEWTEITRLINVTPFGASFRLNHPTEKGRLLHMTIPMPRQLRVFDHVEEQYKVWALTRSVRSLAAANDKAPLFEVGVAFIGKRAPRSYAEDPSRRYEVAHSVTETGTLPEVVDQVVAPFTSEHRVHTRHNIAVDLVLETLDEKGAVALSESTVTENINQQGAAIFTSFAIPSGRIIRLTSHQYNITVYAAVRSRSTGADGIQRVHVEFIDREWPL
jgi:hypothetical protein